MQGLADGYFVLPYTIGDYLAHDIQTPKIKTNTPEFDAAEKNVTDHLRRLYDIKGTKSPDHFHKMLGHIMWDYIGMAREAEGLKKAIKLIAELKEEFYKDLRVTGEFTAMNNELEKAGQCGRLHRHRTPDGIGALDRTNPAEVTSVWNQLPKKVKPKRDDEHYQYVSVWEYKGDNKEPELHKEALVFENIQVAQRSYK